MRYVTTFCSAVLLLALSSFAQSKVEMDDVWHHPFETDFASAEALACISAQQRFILQEAMTIKLLSTLEVQKVAAQRI